MSIISEDEYNQYKSILAGCNNVIDSHYFSELYISGNPNMKNFATSVIYGRDYETSTATFSGIKTVCELLGNCKTKNEAYKIINELPYKNKLQLSTFIRIANSKQEDIIETKSVDSNISSSNSNVMYVHCKDCNYVHNCIKQNSYFYENKIDNPFLNSLFNIDENHITKHCPHCDNSCKGTIETAYIICGYDDHLNGFNWKGCGRDWCFVCGKKLCKQWNENELYTDEQRNHNKECCKRIAKKNNENYEENYCQCC